MNFSGKGGVVQEEWSTNGDDLTPTALRILASAQACFEATSIQKTSIDDIASHCGVSRPTIYRYFPGKQAMLEAIALREMIAIGAEIRKRVPSRGAFADRLTEALFVSIELGGGNGYVQIIINDPAMMRRCFDRSGHLYRWEQEQWQSFIASGRRAGDLAGDLDDGAVVRWLAMSQLMLLLMAERLPDWGSHTRHFIRRFLVEPILARPDAADQAGLGAQLAAMHGLLERQFALIQTLTGYAPKR